jgi:methyl-accepting chemotaxis protein
MVAGIHRAVLAFSSGGARTALGTVAVSSRVHHMRTELEAVTAAVEALHSGAEETAHAGEESARMCSELAGEVERGSAVLARVVVAVEALGAERERIERLADQLQDIAAFSGVIKQVADKTKLLALNATIEAARAGAHGAAFRVVADEIGSLASDSETHTRRIAAVVSATQSDLEPLREAIDAARAHEGVADAHDARETVRRIGALAEKLTAPAEHVAAASEAQLQALGEMTGHMQGTVVGVAEVDEHATQMSAEALTLSASSEDVYELSEAASWHTARSRGPSFGWPSATWPSPKEATTAASCRPTPATPARFSRCCPCRSTSVGSAGARRSSAGIPTTSPPERTPGPPTPLPFLPSPVTRPSEGCRSG